MRHRSRYEQVAAPPSNVAYRRSWHPLDTFGAALRAVGLRREHYRVVTLTKETRAWLQLKLVPVHNPERNNLRDVVKQQGDSLARRAHRYLTLAAVYTERERYAKVVAQGVPSYYKWLASFMSPADARKENERANLEWGKA